MGGRRLCVPSRRQTFAVRQEYVLERFLLSIGVVRRPTAESTASKRSKRDGEIPVFFQGASLALGPTCDLRARSMMLTTTCNLTTHDQIMKCD